MHCLVLEAFIGLRPKNMECCHNDGNPQNNDLTNLRWDTKLSNAKDRIKHGRHRLTQESRDKISKSKGMPQVSSLLKWKHNEKWLTRGAEIEKVETLTRSTFIEKMAAIGMPSDKALEILARGMTEPADVTPMGLDKDDNPVTISTPDFGTIHKYQQTYFKMAGMLDPVSKDGNNFTAGQGGVINVQVNLPSLNEDEA